MFGDHLEEELVAPEGRLLSIRCESSQHPTGPAKVFDSERSCHLIRAGTKSWMATLLLFVSVWS